MAAAVVGSTALACGLALCLRRLTNAFEAPPGPAGLLAVTAAGVGLVLTVDALSRLAGGGGPGSPWPLTARAGLVLALSALVMPPRLTAPLEALSFAAAMLFGGTAIVGPFLGGHDRRGPRLPHGWRRARAGVAPRSRPAGDFAEIAPAFEQPPLPAVLPCPGHLTQRFERYDAAGDDCLRGTLSLAVPQGARTASGHVGFCPSFTQTPIIEVTTAYDGVEAVVAAAEVLPWGVRVECRLDEPAEEAFEIPIDIFASAPA